MSMARNFSCLICGPLPDLPVEQVTVRSGVGHHASVRCPSCRTVAVRRVSAETALLLLAHGAQMQLTWDEVEATGAALLWCDDVIGALEAEVTA